MANERVSQLLELYAGDLASNDLFLVTDMSQRESKKLPLSSLMEYIEKSGSFDASTAGTAATASYVAAVNVDGTVTSASYSGRSSQSDSASYATYAQNSQQAVSSSYASAAASLIGGIGGVVSASHALKADLADNATIAGYLYYSGTPNGTASMGLTASYSDDFKIGYSGADPSVLRPIHMYGAVNDGVYIFFSGSVDDGNLFFRTFDNGTEGYRFQTWQASGGGPVIDRMRLSTVTSSYGTAKLTVWGDVSASAYTASIPTGVGFIGTASYAQTASYMAYGEYGSIKAWAWVTWSAAHSSSCSLYKGGNVSNVSYIRTTNPDTTHSLDHFMVQFTTPLLTTDYMLVGDAIGFASTYIGIPIEGHLTMLPRFVTRYTTGCTMSIWTLTATKGAFYSDATQANFQIIG